MNQKGDVSRPFGSLKLNALLLVYGCRTFDERSFSLNILAV